jgi:predicted metal-dependent hydrolase
LNLLGLFQARPSTPAEVEGLPLVVQVNPRARRISIRVCAATRSVRLTLPPRASRARAAAFLDEQRPWIRHQAAIRLPAPIPFAPGATIPFADGALKLAHGVGRTARREGDTLLVPGTGDLFEGRVRRWLKTEALRLLEPETRALAARLGKPLHCVSTGDYRSRWGSCAQGPNGARITYSWRLVLAPTHVRRAVVAHEVAHMAEPNHGPEFWRLATELLGDSHAGARKWLRHHGPDLHGIGAG